VQAALNQGRIVDVRPQIMRLLELQPGDEWTNTIRHKIDEAEHARTALEKPDAVRPLVFAKPTQATNTTRPRPRQPAPVERQRPPVASVGTTGIEIIEDNDDVDEAWEFGERLVQSAPPPLKRPGSRPPSAKPAPARKDEDEDFIGWLEPEPQTAAPAMWIAIAVSGVVILLALIATIVVLLADRGK